MTEQLRAQAEQLARKLKVGGTVRPPVARHYWMPDFYADVPWDEGVQAILEFAEAVLKNAGGSQDAALSPTLEGQPESKP